MSASIALYGGSFDPPHVAHVLAVAWLVSAAPVDAVWILPAWRHPFGKVSAPFTTRLALCRAAFDLFGAAVEVRDDEARPGASGRSLDLVEHLRAAHPGMRFRWVLGSDQVQARHRWHRFDDLCALAPPLVLGRPGFADAEGLRAQIQLPDVSATDLRQRLASGAAVDGLLPRAVQRAIAAGGLYRAASS